MPKVVDHDERRRDIADAVIRIAGERGLQGVSFREVAAEAEMSVALVQHYVGTKEKLLIGALEEQSRRLDAFTAARLARCAPDTRPLERLEVIACSFLGTEPESREAMLLYHAFAAVALTDPGLRQADAFRNQRRLIDALAGLVAAAQTAGEVDAHVDPVSKAWQLLALVLGLSLGVLLEQLGPDAAESILRTHLAELAPPPRR